jgi:hypothetical protein
VEVAFYWMMAEAFALELDLHQAMVLMIAANLIVSLPLTPWSVGPYELAVTEALVAIGADRVNAGAFALGSHLMLQAWILITGSAAKLALRLGPRDHWPGSHANTEAAARVEGGSRAEGGKAHAVAVGATATGSRRSRAGPRAVPPAPPPASEAAE